MRDTRSFARVSKSTSGFRYAGVLDCPNAHTHAHSDARTGNERFTRLLQLKTRPGTRPPVQPCAGLLSAGQGEPAAPRLEVARPRGRDAPDRRGVRMPVETRDELAELDPRVVEGRKA